MIRDVCRKHNITEQTFFRWRNHFWWDDGLGGTSAQGARSGECGAKEVSSRADPGQPDVAGRECKKVVSLAVKRMTAEYLERDYAVSERRVCRVLGFSRVSKCRRLG